MDPNSLELLRLRKIKLILEREENSLTRMLEVVDNQLLALEVEDLQLASNLREKIEEKFEDEVEFGDESVKEEEKEICNDKDENGRPKLDLDSKLDGILSGEYYVDDFQEEFDDEL